MTKNDVSSAASQVCRKYGVKSIPIRFTDRSGRGLACYVTYRIKVGGKIGKTNYPRYIMIYDWDRNKNYPAEVAYRLGHELAHHIMNSKKNSLVHTSSFYNLEESIARTLTKELKRC